MDFLGTIQEFNICPNGKENGTGRADSPVKVTPVWISWLGVVLMPRIEIAVVVRLEHVLMTAIVIVTTWLPPTIAEKPMHHNMEQIFTLPPPFSPPHPPPHHWSTHPGEWDGEKQVVAPPPPPPHAHHQATHLGEKKKEDEGEGKLSLLLNPCRVDRQLTQARRGR